MKLALTRRHTVGGLLAAGGLIAGALVAGQPASASPSTSSTSSAVSTSSTAGTVAARNTTGSAKPTVVLVHGAWADSSGWAGVITRLQHDGYTVVAPANPLRGLASDTAYLKTFLASITGPIVLVGHSYGGAVITDAATGNANVKSLVYIDAFAPDAGENVLQLTGSDSALANPDLSKVFSTVPGNAAPTADTDLYLLPSVFRKAMAGDESAAKTAVLAATQRPITLGAVSSPSTAPAWRTIPSWYLVGTADRAIPKAAQLAMAHRAKSHIVEVKAAHLSMISKPTAVTHLIETAARAKH
jgi:pimeloyl-ACP methyl ester carboxylesterase